MVLAAPLGLLLTSSLAEVPSLASCETGGSGGMLEGGLGRSHLHFSAGKQSWWLSEEAYSLPLGIG